MIKSEKLHIDWLAVRRLLFKSCHVDWSHVKRGPVFCQALKWIEEESRLLWDERPTDSDLKTSQDDNAPDEGETMLGRPKRIIQKTQRRLIYDIIAATKENGCFSVDVSSVTGIPFKPLRRELESLQKAGILVSKRDRCGKQLAYRFFAKQFELEAPVERDTDIVHSRRLRWIKDIISQQKIIPLRHLLQIIRNNSSSGSKLILSI
jgi:hypothetical protein